MPNAAKIFDALKVANVESLVLVLYFELSFEEPPAGIFVIETLVVQVLALTQEIDPIKIKLKHLNTRVAAIIKKYLTRIKK